MVGDDAVAHAVPPDVVPVFLVCFAVARAIGPPHARARHMLPRRFRVRDVRQRLFEDRRNRDKEPFIDIVPLAVRLRNVFHVTVELDTLAWISRAARTAAVGQIPVRMAAQKQRRGAALRKHDGRAAVRVVIVRYLDLFRERKPFDAAVGDDAHEIAFVLRHRIDHQRLAAQRERVEHFEAVVAAEQFPRGGKAFRRRL